MKRESITIPVGENYDQAILMKWCFIGVVLAGAMVWGGAGRAEDAAAGFAFDRFQLTLEEGFRTEAAGPFYFSQHADAERTWGIPPFYSRDDNPAVDADEDDYLYPLLTRIRYGQERRWQFCELISTSSGLAPDDTTPHRVTVFPFYFSQRAADTNLNYTAVVPFYGRLKHRLFKDEIYFILLPGYVETKKRDVVTENYLFPIVDVHHGDGMTGWQVWPFVGREHKDVTTQTNGFGEVTIVPGHDHAFYLWPFYLTQDNGLGSKNPETFRASFPFYVQDRSAERDLTTVLWPFYTTIDDRVRKYHERQEPWPIVIFADGGGEHTSRVWPFFSESHNDTKEWDSYVWPLYVYTRTHADPLDQQRTRWLFYLYSRLSVKNTETGHERVRLDMWPFFTWHHDFNGNERLQILSILEPFVPDNPRIERNWSPLWALWRAENNAQTGATSRSLLWNLFRRDSAPGRDKVSCLFGLYRYEAKAGGKSLRLFYVPVLRASAK